ncbi:MAG: hypothetical protein A2083_01050 [Gemmatimonadetes bacterium GWC2_71_9]|nr:MAG: hypothetical protein A2083_01050 [Gemmatimonadetes bacterium GWC2_71_9]
MRTAGTDAGRPHGTRTGGDLMALPSRNHHITLAAAALMTRRWRDSTPDDEKGGAFHAEQVLELLDQPGCAALRYYHALNEAGKPALILVGVDVEGVDMSDGTLLELMVPCPPWCGEWSELNSSASPVVTRIARLGATPPALPPRDHHIALEDAARMTRRFRLRVRDRAKGGAFHADQVRELLEQPACVALRYYHALDEAKQYAMVLVGVNPVGADMTDGIVLEFSVPCPPFCGEFSELNSSSRAVAAAERQRVPVLAGLE